MPQTFHKHVIVFTWSGKKVHHGLTKSLKMKHLIEQKVIETLPKKLVETGILDKDLDGYVDYQEEH